MQKRRADMLENLLDQLNPQYYMVACRQLMLDFADALTTLRDLNESKMQVNIKFSIGNDKLKQKHLLNLSALSFKRPLPPLREQRRQKMKSQLRWNGMCGK